MSSLMIEAEGLKKRFGSTQALAGVDLRAPQGSVLGVLGPNGAGKSTAVRILTTLAIPDAGSARVGGFDVVREAPAVRRQIGVTAQDATLDDALTGRQNLVMVGELSGIRRPAAKARARELLDRFGLIEAADRVLKGYSGGMRRRLDLAAGLVARPLVLFLDEPTTGLDPQSRAEVWSIVRSLVADGTTLLLTTQYLEEVDQLADRIAVIDHGRVIAEGTPGELKSAIGNARIDVTLPKPNPGGPSALAPLVDGPVQVSPDGRHLHAAAAAGSVAGLATRVIRSLDAAGVEVDDVEIRQPSLDDVFFALTGHAAIENPTGHSELAGATR